jgi:hypothetical protein
MPKRKFTELVLSPAAPRTHVVNSTAYTVERPSPYNFKPGQSGNPTGKAKNPFLPLSRALKVQLNKRAPNAECLALGLPIYSTWSEVVAAMLTRQAAKGDVASARLLCELTEPKGALATAFTNPDGTPYAPPVMQVRFLASPEAEG